MKQNRPCFLDPQLFPIHERINTYPRAEALCAYLERNRKNLAPSTEWVVVAPGEVLTASGYLVKKTTTPIVHDFMSDVMSYAKAYQPWSVCPMYITPSCLFHRCGVVRQLTGAD